MFFDPIYLLFMIPPLVLSLFASWRTKSAFKKYSKVRTLNGMTGAQAAQPDCHHRGHDDADGNEEPTLPAARLTEKTERRAGVVDQGQIEYRPDHQDLVLLEGRHDPELGQLIEHPDCR